MTVSNDTIYVDVWTNVRTALVAAAPKVTNSTTSETKTASIVAEYSDKKTTSPQIVIQPANKDESEYLFGSTRGRMFINITVSCYYTTSLGVDQLSAAVEKAIAEYDFGNMDVVAVTSDTAFINPNEQKYHLKTITFTFDKR